MILTPNPQESCYCVCHSLVSARAFCEHCKGKNVVSEYHFSDPKKTCLSVNCPERTGGECNINPQVDRELRKKIGSIKIYKHNPTETFRTLSEHKDFEYIMQLIEAHDREVSITGMLLGKWNAYEGLLLNEAIKKNYRKEIQAHATRYEAEYVKRATSQQKDK